MTQQIFISFFVVVCVPLVLLAYVAAADAVASRLPGSRGNRVAPWLWAGPALLFLTVFLVYPTFNTVYLSFQNANSSAFVGLENYRHVFTSRGVLSALKKQRALAAAPDRLHGGLRVGLRRFVRPGSL